MKLCDKAKHGGTVKGKVSQEKYLPSPIPKGGLEIAVETEFSIESEKKQFLERLMDLVDSNYKSPDGAKDGDGVEPEVRVVPDDENEADIVIVLADDEVDVEDVDDGDIDMVIH